MNAPHALLLMGVAGAGKTTIGQELAQKLGCPFYDADNYHSPENVAKMEQGTPLTDDDRLPWLQTLEQLIQEHLEHNNSLILACSALKERYRQTLAQGKPNVTFIHLKGDYGLILSRMKERSGHYMKESMLQSQFEALEEPQEALVISIDKSTDEIVTEILAALELNPHEQPS